MGLKYFTRYQTINGDACEIRFLKEDFDGAPTEWISMEGAVDFEYGGFDGMFSTPIQPSQARMTLYLKELYDLTDFVYNRKTYFCEIVNLDTNIIKWSGWVEPWGATRAHKKAPHVVDLIASCGLAHLSKKKYVNQTNVFKKTGLQIIQECLAIIGSTLPIRVSTHMVETTWGGDDRLGLNSFEINTSRYFDNNGEAMYCDVIINDILNHFDAELVQWENRWVIRAVVGHATGFYNSFIDIGSPDGPLYHPYTYMVNGEDGTVTLDGGTVSILPPINKYRTEIDFGTQVPFFENGNMILWGEDGLVGWDFSHMNKSTTNGWERFEVGGEISRGVLKINGKSPQPYRKKRKKKFGQVLLPVLTGALWKLKREWEQVEPGQYIESPGGSISKGDKSVTITFDYETEAFSSDILISIRIPVTQKTGKIVNFWVDPSSNVALAGADKSTAGASEEFCLIRVPAVDMGTLTDKGSLDVSGNPNYPAANYAPGTKNINWTWTVTGVPPGEYRRVGGINGVLVENGDLVIARIPNNGGSQAQVGGSWEIIGIRNNIKKGTFSLTVALNTLFITKAGDPFPADKIYIRFYKMADDKGLPGDWYKVYNLGGALEGFIAKEESASYATTLERGDVTDEEAETIQLISGDYNPWYAGSWTKPGSIENTRTWRRRPDLNEAMSVYRAMMLDRLCLTSRPLKAIDGDINLAEGTENLTFLHTLLMHDMDDMRMRITRFSFNDYSRRVKFRAIEVKYEEIPRNELRQDAYIPGSRQLNTVPGEGDGIYPSKQDSSSGRLSAEDLPLTDDELYDVIESGSRLAALFENFPPLIFTVGELSTSSVDLSKYLSEVVLYNNAGLDEDVAFDFNTLEWSVVKKPSWVTSQSVVFMNVSVTGKPLYVGPDSITFRVQEYIEEVIEEEEVVVVDPEAEEELEIPEEPALYVDVVIPIIVYPKTILVQDLLDTSGPTPVVIGPLPGVYPLPSRWDIRTRIKGTHDWWQQTLFGGGDAGNDPLKNVSQNVAPTEDGTYRMFLEDNGIVTQAGQYRKFTTTSVADVIISRNNIVFTLYDDDFLAAGGFFLQKGGVNIASIPLDGTGKFENPEGCNVVFVSEGVEHNKVTLKITTKDEQPVGDSVYTPATTDEGTYAFFGQDTQLSNRIYTIQASIYLDDVEVVERFTDFELVKKKPEAEGGQLSLVEKVPGSLNFKHLATLPKSGSEHTLPVNGFNVKATGESSPFDWEGWTYQVIRGDRRVTIDLSKYTGQPQFLSYTYPLTESDLYIFGTLSSLQVDAIHEEDTTHRVIVTRRLGGATGEISAILQADFSFGTFQDPDEVPDEDETSNLVDYVAGAGMSEITENYIKRFNVNVDDETIEIYQQESPDDPTLPGVNHLRVKESGILFEHIQDLPSMTVIGNLTGSTAAPYAVEVKDIMEEADLGDLITAIAIKNYITQQLEGSISGTLNYLPKYTSPHKLGLSQIFDNGTNVGIGTITPASKFSVAGDIRTDSKFIGSYLRFGSSSEDKISLYGDRLGLSNSMGFGVENDNSVTYKAPTAHNWYINSNANGGAAALMRLTGTSLLVNRQVNSSVTGLPPFVVASNLLNVNLHADLLNKSVIAGTGLTGGGIMTADRTLSFDTVFGDARYLTASGTGTIPYVSLSPDFGAGSANVTGYDLNNSVKTSMFFVTSPVNGPTSGDAYFSTIGVGTSSAFQMSHLWGTQDAFYYRRKSGSVFYAWEQVASRSHVLATYMAKTWTLTAGVGLTGGGTGSANRTVSMGTPSTLTNATTNSVSGTTHTHAIQTANLIAGTNVSFSASGSNVILGPNHITIDVAQVPWGIVINRPTTLTGYGITDGVTAVDFTNGLNGKENTFAKGSLIQSSGINLSGTLTNRLVGSGDVTVALQWSGVSAGSYHRVDVDLFGRVTGGSNPTTLAGHGITDAVPSNRTITINGTTYDLSANRSWTIAGGLTGSGTVTRVAVWGAGNTLTDSSALYVVGGQVNVNGNFVMQGGSFVVTNYAGFPSSPISGTIHYNAADDELYLYRFGIGWAPILLGA